MLNSHPLHEEAKLVAVEYRKNETRLISILQEMGRRDLFRMLGYSGAYQYATQWLELSEGQAYTLVNVARLCEKVPELKAAIDEGKLTVSKARRLSSVLEKENAQEWIQKAIDLPHRELEREVVKHNPEVMIQERIRPMYAERSELRCGLTRELEQKLERLREIASRSLRKPASIEETLDYMATFTLKHKDPMQKAERYLQRLASRQNYSAIAQ